MCVDSKLEWDWGIPDHKWAGRRGPARVSHFALYDAFIILDNRIEIFSTMTLGTASNEVNLVRELNLRVHCAFGNVVETLCSCNNYQFCGVFDICYSHYIHLLN